MPGSNNFSTYEGVFGPEMLQQAPLPAVIERKAVPEQKKDSSGWTSPGQAYQAARSQGYNKRVSRLIEGADKFVEGVQNDNPDYKYVRRVLRSQGLTRKAANKAMKDPQFWVNIRKTYGKKLELPGAQPVDQNEATLRDKMDQEALAHEQAGDIYNPETGTWTPKPADTPAVQAQTVEQPEIAQDDLRGIQSFNAAFAEARRRGLKQFQWGNKGMVYGTQLKSNQTPAKKNKAISESQVLSPQATPPVLRAESSYTFPTPWNKSGVIHTQTKSTSDETTKTASQKQKSSNGIMSFFKWLNDAAASNPNNRNKMINPHSYYQKGGKLKDSQKEFVAYLIQISGSQTEQELTDFIQSLGEDGLKQEYQNFLNIMEQGTTSAKNGAKLNYIKSLRGKCPEGYELGYFKEGGHICAKCVEKKEKQGAIPFKPIQGEKGTKVVQNFKKDLKGKKDKITLPKKQTEKKELGGIINIKPEFLEAFKCGGKMKKENGGLVKKDKKIPIKEQFINKDKCGGKAKKKKK